MTAKKDAPVDNAPVDNAPAATQSVGVPAYMQKFMQQSQNDTNSMAASSISVPRLSFRGKRFRWIENGEEELVKALTVDVVILGVEPEAGKMIKTYYDKPYEPGSSEPPTCSSSNGVTPDAWVSDPVNPTCAHCPNNVFGSAVSRSGGKAKKCQDGKRLIVAKPNEIDKYYVLGVPVTSLKNLSEYGKYIGKNQFPLSLVVTTLGMDDDSEFPKITFAHNGFVAEDKVEAAVELNSDRPWRSTFGSQAILPEHSSISGRSNIPQPDSGAKPITGGVVSGTSVDDVVSNW